MRVDPPEERVLARPLYGGAWSQGKRVFVIGREENGIVTVYPDHGGGEARFPEEYLVPGRVRKVVSV